jgi:protein transport protein SEC61 subunit gamma-like protein
MDENIQQGKPTFWFKLKRFIIECIRVLKITKKPEKAEFKTIAKAAGIGVLIIGLIGFIIQMATYFLKGGF